MKLDWIDWNFLLENYLENEIYDKKYYLKKVVSQLFEKYPTPDKWLYTPIKERLTFSSRDYSDLNYIACWAWDKELFRNKEYSPILLEYFLDKRHDTSKVPLSLSKKFNLLTEKEIYAIRDYKDGILKFVAIHCLFLSKSFKEFTNDDLYKIPNLLDKKKYTLTALQNIRIKLGYSNTIVKRKSRENNWDKLMKDSNHGMLFKKFYEYLIRCDVRTKYLSYMGTTLMHLLKYMKNNSIYDCSNFNALNFKNFTEYLRESIEDSSTLGYIAKLKRFFEWGLGFNKFFPTELDFPNTYWQELMRKVKKEQKDKDGRAFSEPELAEQIVNIVYNYKPQNEIDDLCRKFWLILSSCPARFSYVLNLRSDNAIQPLPNEPDTFGIYSELADKAGNKYGQFPILDKLGLEAVKALQSRAIKLNLKPIENPSNKKNYVHLFQLTNAPWILDKNMLRNFFEYNIKSQLSKLYINFEDIQASAHGFRHHLLTHVALETGDITVVQTASGHNNEKMTREYLKSKVSRNALLFRVMKKYESKEITGKFYLRLVELLSSEETPVDEMLRALTTEMKLDEFLNQYGKKLDMGYCFNNSDCSNWLKCWSCTNFLMTKEEIIHAIKTLSHQIITLREMQKNSIDFSFEHPVIKKQIKTISLIVKRLTELDLTEEQITRMVDNYLHNKKIEEGVIYNES